MAISIAAALVLAAQCAPSVAPETLLSVVQVESRFDPLAIGVNGTPRVAVLPVSVDEAVAKAEALIASGRNIDLGLAQINSRNLSWLGLDVRAAFDPCTNLRAAARVLQAGYARSDARHGEQAALRTALSYYNTGHPVRGFNNGYVARVTSAAERVVPAIAQAGPDSSLPNAPVPAVAPAPSWDVFGETRTDRIGFVITVSNPESGGSQ